MAITVSNLARKVNLSATNHQGWEADNAMADGDCFVFGFLLSSYSQYAIGLGVGLGAGNIYSKQAHMRYGIEYVNSSTVNVWDNGVSTAAPGSYTTTWWTIERSGNDYVVKCFDAVVATWTNATAYKVGQYGYLASGTVAGADDDWDLSIVPGAGSSTLSYSTTYQGMTKGTGGGGGISGYPRSRLVNR